MTTPDLLSPAFYADIDGMHRALTALRAEGPVWRDEANALWAVLGHDEIIDVEARADVFCSGAGFRAGLMPEGSEQDMIALDDPAHAAQRRLVARRFTPKAVRAHTRVPRPPDGWPDRRFRRPGLGRAGRRAGGAVAVVRHRDVARVPGVRCADHAIVVRAPDAPGRDAQRPRASSAEFMGAVMEIAQSVGEIVPQRRDDPRDDLLSVWSNAELDGCPVSHETIVQEVGLFVSGGAETTRTVISRGLVELARHPDDWEAMRDDPALVPGAVEELIRWVTPLNNFFRTATRDDEIAGRTVAAGDRVILMYPVRQPRRTRLRRPVHLRHPAPSQPARLVRLRHPLLPRSVAGPAPAPHAAREADIADHVARGAGTAGHRTEHLRRRGAVGPAGIRQAVSASAGGPARQLGRPLEGDGGEREQLVVVAGVGQLDGDHAVITGIA